MVAIIIKGLFGRFEYDIKLAEERITILTGPNGYGKSTIIRSIKALRDSDIDFFAELEFDSLEIVKENAEDNLLIEKKEDKLIFNHKITIDKESMILWRKGRLRRETHGLNTYLTDEGKVNLTYKNHGVVLQWMQQAVGKVECIDEQRLIRVDERRMTRRTEDGRVIDRRVVNVVEEIPAKLMLEMQRVANEYSRVANELDSTYPERLFEQKEDIQKEEFEKNLVSMQEKVEKLNKYGISNISKLRHVEFQAEYAKALKVYFDDFDRKYHEYEDLIDKLDLFTDMINRRFKFKQVVISNEYGMRVVDNNDKEMKLSKLSSGEKEILVLFYQLLFEVEDEVMLLVDEPEISLHVAWQRMFAEDLKKIVARKNITAIVATHSPQMINGNSRIQRDLGALYAKRLNKRELK